MSLSSRQFNYDVNNLLAALAEVKQRTDSTLTNVGTLSVLLQDSKLPDLFVQPDEEKPTKFDLQQDIQIPEVDISVFNTAENPGREDALATIVRACQTWGFVQVVGHGIDGDLIKRTESEAHRLFQLPASVKENTLRGPGALYGYGANFMQNLAAMMWAESFHVSKVNVGQYAAKLWPSEWEQFSCTVEDYIDQVVTLAHRIRHILTEGLGLSEDHFDAWFGEEETVSTIRFNYFPPCPEPSKALGLKSHRDPHFLTLLHQDETGGLQIWNESRDEWFNVKPVPNSYIINVGDMFQAASNGIYRSVLHRVVVNKHKPRLSMAFFYNTTAIVDAPSELITAENLRRYRPFTWPEFVRTAYKVTTGRVSQVDQLFGILSSKV